MGLFGRLFGKREEAQRDTERDAQFHRVADQPVVSAEQERKSRDVMESQMDASRKKRDAESAAAEDKPE